MKKLLLVAFLFSTAAHAAVVTSVSEGGVRYHFSDTTTTYRGTSEGMVQLTSGVEGDTWEHDGTVTCQWTEYSWDIEDKSLVQHKKGAVFKSTERNESTVNVYDGEKVIVTINVN